MTGGVWITCWEAARDVLMGDEESDQNVSDLYSDEPRACAP